jgi:thymidylate synthase (FAD)
MRVRLLTFTPEPEKIAAAAARSCKSRKDAAELLKDEGERLPRVLRTCVEMGHTSVLEHAVFTFSISGVSRACTHELVRHRIASYSQQSQRSVRVEKSDYVVPPTIEGRQEAEAVYREAIARAMEAYGRLAEMGIPLEDARYVLPNATYTNIVVTMNARSLLNFFELRCCMKAQWEIRKLANEMLRLVREVAPAIFEKAGPACVSRGVCPYRDESCPMYPRMKA